MTRRVTKLNNLSSEALRRRLATLLVRTHENIVEICDILLEQQDRGELDPSMRKGVLQWYRAIAQRQLHPDVVLFLAGDASRVRSMIGLPLDLQRRLARGEPVTLATHNERGDIVAEDKRIERMTRREFNLAFAPGELRPFAAQKALLAVRGARGTSTRRSSVPINIRVDVATEEIVVGQLRLRAAEVALALGQLGFRVTRKNRLAA